MINNTKNVIKTNFVFWWRFSIVVLIDKQKSNRQFSGSCFLSRTI